jgi:hypothetical protein
LATAIALAYGHLSAQHVLRHDSRAWVGYISQSKVANKWSIWNDVHFMPGSFLVLRTGLTYLVEKPYRMSFTAGYAHGWLVPDIEGVRFRNEHRPWMQATMSYRKNRYDFFHRLRIEARFRQKIFARELLDEFNFNHRLRYMFQLRLPFTTDRDHHTYAVFADEILFDQGHEIQGNFRLNQNRVAIGIGRKIKNTSIQLDYVNILFPPPQDRAWKMTHVGRIMVLQNFDFSKKVSVD